MTRDRLAARVGVLAGALGVAAGLVAAVWGTRLGAWAGNKVDPTALGLLTVAFSLVAIAASLGSRSALPSVRPGRRAAVAAGQLLPGLLGFTTVGRLWWIPGTLLIIASVVTVSVAPTAIAHAVRDRWPAVLTGALGVFLILTAAPAGTPLRVFAALSGALMALALWPVARPCPLAAAMLVAGTIPFAVVTWWTLVTPLIAVLGLATGVTALRRVDGRADRPRPAADGPPRRPGEE